MLKSSALLFLAAFWLGSGCGDQGPRPGEEAPPPSAQTGRYGVVTALSRTNLAKARPPLSLTEAGWDTAAFALLQTELSPATLIRCESAYLGLFRDLGMRGREGPSHVAFSSRAGPRAFGRGANLDVVDMEESWVVVWFAGSRGWAAWDSPWAVFLQEKPLAIRLDQAGLHFRFRERAGEVALMPLYGCRKLPPPGQSFAARYGLPPKEELRTEDWDKALPRELLMRVRYWAGVARAFPVYCEDRFAVDRSRDTIILRQKFHWHTTSDAWMTQPVRLAPVSPVLALAAQDDLFAVRFSAPMLDLDLVTPYGPYTGMQRVDTVDAAFPLLKYIHETERSDPADPPSHPAVTNALRRLQQTVQETLAGLEQHPPATAQSAGIGSVPSELLGLAKAIPFCAPPTRTNAWRVLQQHLHSAIRAAEDPHLLELLWTYADLSGDWELIRSRWDAIKGTTPTLARVRWAGFGRSGVVSLGDQAAPCLALARMAYRVADLDTYQYACSLFARELVLHQAKQRGADYFRRHQPCHSLVPMPQEVYLTSLQDGSGGWHLEGPSYPAPDGPGDYQRRWLRFDNEDVARFYRDFLRPDVARELDRLERQNSEWPGSKPNPWSPSFLRLRSLLLNSPPDQLLAATSVEPFAGPRARVLADCLALLRTSHPIRFERLIPAAKPGPFLLGLERDVAEPNPHLILKVETHQQDRDSREETLTWPTLTDGRGGFTPGGQPVDYGCIMPLPEGSPRSLQIVPLNWNTRVLLYSY